MTREWIQEVFPETNYFQEVVPDTTDFQECVPKYGGYSGSSS